MSIERILVIVSIGLNLLMIVAALIAKIFKGSKTGSVANKFYNIVRKIQLLIVDAETHTNYTGVEKFDYVMTGMNKYLLESNLKIDVETITTLIENELDLSNQVNTKETKKATNEQETENVSHETKTEV